jgi:chromosome segregation ATPase
MDTSELISTVGGGSGIAAVLVVAIPRVLDAIRASRRDDAKGTELAAELVRERADEHRECREEVAQLRDQVGDLRVSIVACESKHEHAERLIADLFRRLTRIERDSDHPQPEPAE